MVTHSSALPNPDLPAADPRDRSYGRLLLLVLAATSLGCASPDYVARVGDRTITVPEFATRARALVKSGFRGLDTLRQEDREKLLKGIVSQELVILDGLARGLDRDSVIAEEVQHVEQRELMDRLYREQADGKEATASEEELHRLWSEGGYDQEVLTQQIVCASAEEAQAALAGLSRGEEFSAMVSRYSLRRLRDRFGADGDIGWVKIADMLDALKGPVVSMPVNSVYSTPVRTELGFHVFRLNGRRPVSFESVREILAQVRRSRAMGEGRAAYVRELRQRYKLTAHPEAVGRLLTLPADQKEYAGDDLVLYTWEGGQLTARDYMAKHRAGRVKHPASLDSVGLTKAADNQAGQRVMVAEARRLGLDRDLAVRAEWEKKRNELISRWLFGLEGRAKADQVSDEQVRAYYDEHIAQYTRPDGKVTPLESVKSGIHRLLRQVAENRAMDQYLTRLHEQYRGQMEMHPDRLEQAFAGR